MTKIKWVSINKNATIVDLSFKGITEMNWENAPKNLQQIYLDHNQIRELNWENAPKNLQDILLLSNQIRELRWENAPKNLQTIYLGNNEIREMNFLGAPEHIQLFYGPFQNEYKAYQKQCNAARVMQRNYLRHFTRRKYASMVICRASFNWVWKPVCKDGSIGIRPRLDMLALDL